MERKSDLPISVRFASFLSKITFERVKPILLYKYRTLLDFMIRDQQDVLERWKIDYTFPDEARIPKIIWVMWWKGDYHDNPIVSVCISRMKRFAEEYGYDLRLITESNLGDYIDLSDILSLQENGCLTVQGLSDSIRFCLLRENGGLWMDATIFLTNKASVFLNSIQKNERFFSISLKDYPRWKNVSGGTITSYFWATCPNNAYFGFLDEFYNGFLRKHGFSIDYFMNDYSIRIAHDELEYARNMVDNLLPSNPKIYFLNRNLFEEYKEEVLSNILESTVLFKMNWRKKIIKTNGNTYWDRFFLISD